jgi:hypothetical protein
MSGGWGWGGGGRDGQGGKRAAAAAGRARACAVGMRLPCAPGAADAPQSPGSSEGPLRRAAPKLSPALPCPLLAPAPGGHPQPRARSPTGHPPFTPLSLPAAHQEDRAAPLPNVRQREAIQSKRQAATADVRGGAGGGDNSSARRRAACCAPCRPPVRADPLPRPAGAPAAPPQERAVAAVAKDREKVDELRADLAAKIASFVAERRRAAEAAAEERADLEQQRATNQARGLPRAPQRSPRERPTGRRRKHRPLLRSRALRRRCWRSSPPATTPCSSTRRCAAGGWLWGPRRLSWQLGFICVMRRLLRLC